MKHVIELVNLNEKGVIANKFDNISLEVNKKQIFGLFDFRDQKIINILQNIVGNKKVTQGTLRVLGETNIMSIRHRIGTTFDIAGLRPRYSIERNLQMMAMIKDVEVQHVKEVLTKFHLKTHAHQLLRNCSNELKQVVTLACAFLGHPDLIILAHPLKYLSSDEKQVANLKKQIRKAIRNGQTVLIGANPSTPLFGICTHTLCLGQKDKKKDKVPSKADLTLIHRTLAKQHLQPQKGFRRVSSA